MKTSRPGYYLPSRTTVLRDVRLVFARTRNRIAKILQVSSDAHYREEILKKNIPGIQRKNELHDGCMDLT